MRNFFSRLREEREKLGLSQEEFGEKCGVRKQAQCLYENGKGRPNSAYLEAAVALGVDIGYIFTGKASQTTDAHIDRARLKLAIEAVEEGLKEAKLIMEPAKKAELILAACDLINSEMGSKEKLQKLLKLVA